MSVLGLIAWPAFGASVHLAWDPSPGMEVIGYRIYCRLLRGDGWTTLDAGPHLTSVVSDMKPGTTYVFVVTAYNPDGLESEPSNEVTYTTPFSTDPPLMEPQK